MNPFLIKWKPRYAIVDFRADEKIIDTIKKFDIIPIKTIKCDDILEQVCGHPDMVLHPIDNKTIVVAPNVIDYYEEVFKNSGIKVIKGGKTLSRNYPNDIAYNVARIRNYAIHNLKYTDEILKYYLQKSDISFIHVNQGYTKCSTACVSNDRAITSDITIYNTIKSLGIDCLYFDGRNVFLSGFDYGFAGGCMGILDHRTFFLTGQIQDSAEKEILYKFVSDSGLKIIEGSGNILTDYGTIIVI